MGLKQHEIEAIAPKALECGKMLIDSFGADSDGGKNLTAKEVKAIGKCLLQLGLRIVLDVLD